MGSLLFNILKIKLYILSFLPLRMLYIFSDILYFIVYYVVGYRKRVVRQNISNSFSDKSSKEILLIEKDFYKHFCDYLVETIKLLHISDQEMMKRMRFTNTPKVEAILANGNHVFLMLGHYCNWEWVTSLNLWLSSNEYNVGQIYRPLKNKSADHFFLKLRDRFHTFCIAKNDTLREIIRLNKEHQSMLIGFISDQTPSKNNLHYWTTFLNQDTPILTGAEKIGKRIGAKFVYLDIQKIKRGYYEATYIIINPEEREYAEYEITELYIRLMEKSIKRAPQYWLWSHKRWKHKRNSEI